MHGKCGGNSISSSRAKTKMSVLLKYIILLKSPISVCLEHALDAMEGIYLGCFIRGIHERRAIV